MGRSHRTLQDHRLNRKVGQRLRQLRRGKAQAEIASMVGVHQTQVSQWERGKNLFSLSRLPKVAMAYGVPDVAEFVRLLFNGDDEEGEEAAWRVGTGMVVRVSGLYACERCGDVRHFKSATIAPKCHACGETIWKRQVLW